MSRPLLREGLSFLRYCRVFTGPERRLQLASGTTIAVVPEHGFPY